MTGDRYNGLRIELRPHIGLCQGPLGLQEVEHDQWYVIAHTQDGMATQLGYKNKRKNSPILYIGDFLTELAPYMRERAELLAEEEAEKLRTPAPQAAGESE
jgi:hypothetical protein